MFGEVWQELVWSGGDELSLVLEVDFIVESPVGFALCNVELRHQKGVLNLIVDKSKYYVFHGVHKSLCTRTFACINSIFLQRIFDIFSSFIEVQ